MIIVDFLLGYFSSIVPLYVLTGNYKYNRDAGYDVDSFDYIGTLRYAPVFFGFTNVLIMQAIDSLHYNDRYRFILSGIIAGIIYSSIGRFYLMIPQKVLHMEEPIYFNILAIFTWVIVYYILYIARDTIKKN